MKPEDLARLAGTARMAVGAAFLLAPKRAGRAWVGRDASRASVATLGRGMGARELAVGLGTVLALQHQAPVRGWLEAGMLADAGDALATLLAFRQLPRTGRLLVLGMAGASAVGHYQLSRRS